MRSTHRERNKRLLTVNSVSNQSIPKQHNNNNSNRLRSCYVCSGLVNQEPLMS